MPAGLPGLHRSRTLFSGIAALLFFFVAPATIASQPPDPEVELLWDRAQDAIGKGDYKEADKLLRQYVVLEPENEAAIRDLARVLSWQARYDESLQYFTIYLEQFSYDVDVAVERAQVIAWQGKYPEAEAEVRKILQREPENIDANLLLAGVLEWQGKKREAKEVYNWILKLDPDNPSARKGRQEVRRELSPVLELLLSYAQDNGGYLFLGASEGVWLPLTAGFALKPFLSQAHVADDGTGPLYALGGGLAGRWATTDDLTLNARGDTAYVTGGRDPFVDWGGELTVSWTPWDSVYLEAGLDTASYGMMSQSAASLEAGVRIWRGNASASYSTGDFAAYGSMSAGSLVLDGEQVDIVTSALLYPRLRLFGEDPRFFLGTRHWYTGHTEPAPDDLYWSPARHFSHQLAARLEGDAFGNSQYYLEASGGFGHELVPASGVGTTLEEDKHWDFFPTYGGGAGLSTNWTTRLSTALGAWMAATQRGSHDYFLWAADMNLSYRW